MTSVWAGPGEAPTILVRVAVAGIDLLHCSGKIEGT